MHWKSVGQTKDKKVKICHLLTTVTTVPRVRQGCWRKVTVDDAIPFDDEDNMLLPASTTEGELWPMLLAKALIKLANTE